MINSEIVKIASNTSNVGLKNDYTYKSSKKNSMCGDLIKVELIVKKSKINSMRYETESCIYCNASASLLADKIKNKSVKDTLKFLKSSDTLFKNKGYNKKGNWTSFKKIMNKSNLSRKECLLLPLKTLLKALNN